MKKHKMEQRSDEWLHLKKGKISGTVLAAIMGTKQKRQDAIYELISQRLRIGLEDDENPMDRGTRLEPEGIAAFEFETGLKVDKLGIGEEDDNPNIIQSPDGLIGEDAAVEIKCPGGKNHVKVWLTNEIPDTYLWQSVQYFVVNEKLKTLYFVSYNPDITEHPLHIIETTREKLTKEIDEALKSEIEVLNEVDKILKTIIKI